MLLLMVAVVDIGPVAHAYGRHGRKYKPPPPMAKLHVTVLRAEDGKPLKNAAVVFHPKLNGEDEGNMELKTNEDGEATLSIVPVGSKVLVQVIASGYRTYGKEYDVPGDEKSITIRLLPPKQQYSIYAENPETSDTRTNTPKTEMGHAAPTDSPLISPPEKKH